MERRDSDVAARLALGRRIQHLRKAVGMSQELLGSYFGMGQREWSQRERTGFIHGYEMVLIANILRVPLEAFYDDVWYREGPPIDWATQALLAQLTPVQHEAHRAFLRAMLAKPAGLSEEEMVTEGLREVG